MAMSFFLTAVNQFQLPVEVVSVVGWYLAVHNGLFGEDGIFIIHNSA
jgi:hypothetical protein